MMTLTSSEEEQLKAEIRKYDPENRAPHYLILSLHKWGGERIKCARSVLEDLGCELAPQRADGIDVNCVSDRALEWAGVSR